jgi:hypothetical protein
MADYCTLAEVKADMPESGLSSSTDYDTALTQMVTDASRLIDSLVGRWDNFFYSSTAGETRYYDGNADVEMRVDEMVSITSVAVSEQGGVESSDYTSWSSSDYYSWPYNATVNAEPIRKLCVDVWNGSKTYWNPYRKSVKVVGMFGWSATPPAVIARAARIQAMRWFMRAKQGYQDAGAIVELGQMMYVKELDPDVQKILHRWMIENNL